jgi:phage terminase large subunit-like protein
VSNCVLKVDQRGSRLAKETKSSQRRIDLAVAAVMAFERAAWHAGQNHDYDLLESVH